MKIGDIEIGKEYGAHDEPARSHSTRNPRQVRVLEIVTVEEAMHSRYTASSRIKNVRRVKVEVLDLCDRERRSGWHRDKIKDAAKGDTIVIEARNLVGKWKDLHADITKRRNAEQARLEAEQGLEARIVALVGGKRDYDRFTLMVRGPNPQAFEATIKGKTLERLLALAEKGKASA